MTGSPDRDGVCALTEALVAISSLSGEEAAVQSFIVNWFRERGLAPGIEPAEDGLHNVVVEVAGAGDGPVLAIGGHCDTVAAGPGWSTDPLRPTRKDGRLYGLGALDMKGGLAAAMLATVDLAARRQDIRGRILFLALADEEAHSRGARAFLRSGRHVDAAVMAEPHFDDVVTSAIGKFNLTLRATGRSAHGSRPAEGVNAVVELARLVAAVGTLERKVHPVHGPATHCVLRMAGGTGRYEIRVPDAAEALVNWHLMPGESPAESAAAVERLAADLGSQATFAVSMAEPVYGSFELPPNHSFLATFADSYRAVLGKTPDWHFGTGVSDANLFNAAGIPTLLFGPRGRNLHAADEWVEIADLEATRSVLRQLGLTFASSIAEDTSHAR